MKGLLLREDMSYYTKVLRPIVNFIYTPQLNSKVVRAIITNLTINNIHSAVAGGKTLPCFKAKCPPRKI